MIIQCYRAVTGGPAFKIKFFLLKSNNFTGAGRRLMFALQVKTLHHVFPTKIYTLLRSDDMHIVSRCNGNGLFVTSGCVVDMVTRALLIPIQLEV